MSEEHPETTTTAPFTKRFETLWISLGDKGLQNDWDIDGINASINYRCMELEKHGYEVISVFGTTSYFDSAYNVYPDYNTSATKYIAIVGRKK